MFQRLQTLFKQKPSPPLPKAPQKSDRYVLVLSGGGTRGFYTLGVLKAMEEYDMKGKIDAIYGISV
jgi:predicted acylesterase/phospholipase RssA